jgi:gliding motility-associated-like protein
LVYTVTPVSGAAGSCEGASFTITVTVNPKPVIANTTVIACSGLPFVKSPVNGLDIVPLNTLYTWTVIDNSNVTGESNQSIGQSSISQTLINLSNILTATVVYTVTPISGVAGNCVGAPFTLTVTINPKPIINNKSATICSGTSFSISPASGLNGDLFQAGITYSWGIPVVTGGLQGGAIGTNATSISAILINPTNTVQTATYTVFPISNNCGGSSFTVIVTVNPTPKIPNILQPICSGSSFSLTPINGQPTSATIIPINTTYVWTISTNSNVTGQSAQPIGQSGISQSLVNLTSSPQDIIYTIIPTSGAAGNCVGDPFTLTIRVNPKPVVSNKTSSVCSGSAFSIPLFNMVNGDVIPTGTTYSWGIPVVTNGLLGGTAVNGQSTISAILNNSTNTIQTATYTVVPSFANCDGASFTVTITVNPTPVIANIAKSICSEMLFSTTPTNGTDIVPIGTTYTWTVVDNVNITGESSQGISQTNISQTLINLTNIAQNVVYTVTPKSGDVGSCLGTPFTLTVTVNPKPIISTQLTSTCSGVPFSKTPINGTDIVPANTTYTWTIIDNGNITGESDQIVGKTAISQTLVNLTNTIQQVVYLVTPTSGVAGICNGAIFLLIVTVNPTPLIANTTKNICSGTPFIYMPINGTDIVPPNTRYTWTFIDNTNITGESNQSVSQLSIDQTLTNLTNTTQTVVYTVTPFNGTCVGAPFNVTVSVSPKPVIANVVRTVCSGLAFTVTPINGTDIVPINTLYTWTVATNTNVTGQSNQVVGQSSIGQTLTNVSNIVQTLIYTVTPISGATGSCVGGSFTVTVTVNPTPVIANVTRTICSGLGFTVTPVNVTDIVPANTLYTWTVVSNVNVTGQSNQVVGQTSIGQTLSNLSIVVQTLVYTATPISGNCSGTPFTVTVTVKPTPVIANNTTTICSENMFTANLLNGSDLIPLGTTYSWPLPIVDLGIVGGVAGSSQNNVTGTLINTSVNNVLKATYKITPTNGICIGADFSLIVSVLPKPKLISSQSTTTICTNTNFNYVFASSIPNTSFNWQRPFVNGISNLAATGSGNSINEVLINQTNQPITVLYNITLTSNNCAYNETITVVVNPSVKAQFATNAGVTNCSPFDFNTYINQSDYTKVKWYYTASDGTPIADYNGNSSSYQFKNAGNYKVVMVGYSSNGCSDTTQKIISITQSPTVKFSSVDSVYCGPKQTINFTNETINTEAGKLTFKWFVDGVLQSTDSAKLSQLFSIPATQLTPVKFDISLEATNTLTGCVGILHKSIIILPKPIADFIPNPISSCVPMVVNFSNKSSNSTIYKWYLNDSLFSTNSDPSAMSINKPGTSFNIKLYVANDNGCGPDSVTKIVTTLANPKPILTLSQTEGCGLSTVSATAYSDANAVAISNRKWIWTSIPTTNNTPQVLNVNNTTIISIFPNSNSLIDIVYQLKLIESNANGCIDSTIQFFNLHPRPKADFNYPIADSCSSWLLRLRNVTNLGNGDNLLTGIYQWSVRRRSTYEKMGTGIVIDSSKNLNPVFNLTNTGIMDSLYDITLVSINKYGCSDTLTKTFNTHPPAKANLNVSLYQSYPPFVITGGNNITAIDYPFANNNYIWRIQNPITGALLASNTGIILNPYTIINANDSVLVKLIALSLNGCKSDTASALFVTFTIIIPDFNVSTASDCSQPNKFTFVDASTSLNSKIVKRWWSFGDGVSDTGAVAVHSYLLPGVYWPSLYVQDSNGYISKIIKKRIFVYESPFADFVVNSICLNTNNLFFNTSKLGIGNTKFDKYSWDFGDGYNSNLESPNHVYTNAGIYSVSLTIKADSSCVYVTKTMKVTVVGKPKANFINSSFCVDVPVIFTSNSMPGFGSNNYQVVSWKIGNSYFNNTKQTQYIFTAPGTYSITLIVESDVCPGLRDTLQRDIIIYTVRNPITYSIVNATRNNPILLSAMLGGISYLWSPPLGLSDTKVRTPLAIYQATDPDKIYYTIAITDTNKCVVNDRQEVWVFNKPDVFVPTGFTPNGDGVNDVLLPFYVGISKLDYFRLFDRWGKLIFETNDMKNGWDGLIKGSLGAIETYAWVVSCSDIGNKKIFKKGMVTLIRD